MRGEINRRFLSDVLRWSGLVVGGWGVAIIAGAED